MTSPAGFGADGTGWPARLCRLDLIPRPHPDAAATGTDAALRQRVAALTAAHAAGTGGLVVVAWTRAAHRGPLSVWIGSDTLVGQAIPGVEEAAPGSGQATPDTLAGQGAPDTGEVPPGGGESRCEVMFPPGASGRPASQEDLERVLGGFGHWRAIDLVQSADDEARQRVRAEGLLRPTLEDALAGAWAGPAAYAVLATPVPAARAQDETDRLELVSRGAVMRGVEHEREADMIRRRYRELREGQTSGVWDVAVLAGGQSPADMESLAGLLAAAVDLDGTDWMARPGTCTAGSYAQLRTALCSAGSGRPSAVTDVLARLARPPIREVSGVRAALTPDFDVVMEQPGSLLIGQILDAQLRPAGDFAVRDETLKRHTFVAGATGAGKSNTVRHLLDQVTRRDKPLPWMVLEPAKAEYRSMRERLGDLGDRGTVLILRPGAADQVAVGINPLEPCPPPGGRGPAFPLQTHADMVRALFLAAFDAQEPFPQVLAAAMTRCYEEQGWDLILSRPRGDRKSSRYPSLGDLQRVAKQVVGEIGYGKEVLDNVRGFVDVRLNSLRLGTSGRFLEGGHPLDIGALLRSRVVVELEDVGDDQDKAFLMGVVLIRVYEYLRLAHAGDRDVPLQHLMVIEEAHRLLRRPDAAAGPAAHAVELFAGMLAEVRAYGQGIVVAEQIPAKILPDVVKNTALKIVHRLPSEDDRRFVGATMNLTDTQSQYVVSLRAGQAAAFADGMDSPVLVQVPQAGIAGEIVGTAGREGAARGPGQLPATRSFSITCAQACRDGRDRCTVARQREATLIEGFDVLRLWAELDVVRLLTGLGTQTPNAARWASLCAQWVVHERLAQCALAQAVDAAVRPRAAVIGRDLDADALATWVTSSIAGQLASPFPPPPPPRHQFTATYFLCEYLSAALQRGIAIPPEDLARLPGWVGRPPSPELPARLRSLAIELKPTRDQLVWGAAAPSYLEQVAGLARPRPDLADRLVARLATMFRAPEELRIVLTPDRLDTRK